MKKTIALLVVLAIIPFAMAQTSAQTNADAQAHLALQTDAGVTPDSAFYGISVAIDRLRVALQPSAQARAEKSLEVANERLVELEAMLEAENEQAAERAEQEHSRSLERAEQAIARIEVDNDSESQATLETTSKLRIQTQAQLEHASNLREQALMAQSNVSAEKSARINEMFLRVTTRAQETDELVADRHAQALARLESNVGVEQASTVNAQIAQETGLLAVLEVRSERLNKRSEESSSSADTRNTQISASVNSQLENVRTSISSSTTTNTQVGVGSSANVTAQSTTNVGITG